VIFDDKELKVCEKNLCQAEDFLKIMEERVVSFDEATKLCGDI
jgi:hypothetical protein